MEPEQPQKRANTGLDVVQEELHRARCAQYGYEGLPLDTVSAWWLSQVILSEQGQRTGLVYSHRCYGRLLYVRLEQAPEPHYFVGFQYSEDEVGFEEFPVAHLERLEASLRLIEARYAELGALPEHLVELTEAAALQMLEVPQAQPRQRQRRVLQAPRSAQVVEEMDQEPQ